MSRALAVLLIFVTSTGAHAAAASRVRDGVRETLDVRYNSGWNTRHKLDIFAPANLKSSEKRPVVLFVHGGTWMIGDKNFFGIYREVGRCLARNGMVGVLINYRLSPLVKHPEHVRDVARAFAWVRSNIRGHGGDPNNLFLAGHSAGAHLVSLLATDEEYLKDPKLELEERDRKALKGVVSISGVYRIPPPTEFRAMAKRMVELWVGEPENSRFASVAVPALMTISGPVNPFNIVFGKSSEVQSKASPINHVRSGLPPFLMINAEAEVPGLHRMADDFCEALKKHHVPVEHHEIEGTTHRTIVKKLHYTDERAARLIMAFVKRYSS